MVELPGGSAPAGHGGVHGGVSLPLDHCLIGKFDALLGGGPIGLLKRMTRVKNSFFRFYETNRLDLTC